MLGLILIDFNYFKCMCTYSCSHQGRSPSNPVHTDGSSARLLQADRNTIHWRGHTAEPALPPHRIHTYGNRRTNQSQTHRSVEINEYFYQYQWPQSSAKISNTLEHKPHSGHSWHPPHQAYSDTGQCEGHNDQCHMESNCILGKTK